MNQKSSILAPDTPILLVEDSEDYAKVLDRILKQGFGYKDVTWVSTVGAAKEAIEADPGKYQIFFIDYHYPEGETGDDLVQYLKSNDMLGKTAAFFITAEPDVAKAKLAAENGMAGVVAKPFNREQLMGALKRVDWMLQQDDA